MAAIIMYLFLIFAWFSKMQISYFHSISLKKRMLKKNQIIYGYHSVTEALDAGNPIRKVYIQRDIKNQRMDEIRAKLIRLEIPFQYVPKEKMTRLSNVKHQGLIALPSPIEYQKLENLIPFLFETKKSPLIAYLDAITDVRNFGAIARSADCFDIHAMIIADKGSADINEEAVKASSGALMGINLCRINAVPLAMKYIKDSGLQIVALSEKAETAMDKIDWSLPGCIILGNEGAGVSDGLLSIADHIVSIPMTGKIASLNVSVAAGIAFYEISKQRRLSGLYH
jgi:23S rRNA (guanosine2251-2'-O)-methyltransferase